MEVYLEKKRIQVSYCMQLAVCLMVQQASGQAGWQAVELFDTNEGRYEKDEIVNECV